MNRNQGKQPDKTRPQNQHGGDMKNPDQQQQQRTPTPTPPEVKKDDRTHRGQQK